MRKERKQFAKKEKIIIIAMLNPSSREKKSSTKIKPNPSLTVEKSNMKAIMNPFSTVEKSTIRTIPNPS